MTPEQITTDDSPHIPVLLNEVLSFVPQTAQIIGDLTAGFGGHSRHFIEKFPTATCLLNDRDEIAADWCRQKLDHNSNVKIFNHDFVSFLRKSLDENTLFDFILADLGVSSLQLDNPLRGFSFKSDVPLDMRMSQEYGHLTAEHIINEYSVGELTKIFFEYGEENRSRAIVRDIDDTRRKNRIVTNKQLVDIILRNKSFNPRSKIHPATKIFMALRIETNKELEQLKLLMELAPKCLAEGGRIAVISFHSLEDRIVKQSFRKLSQECVCPPHFPVCRCDSVKLFELVTKKAVKPTDSEEKTNPRSRSARFRVLEKLST